MNALVPRATVAQIVGHRNRALSLYAGAHAALVAANEAIEAARNAAKSASSGVNRYNFHADHAKKCFMAGLEIPSIADFLATARKLTDTDVWAHLIQVTDLERLMDKKAKDQFNQQLLSDPPEATEENIFATLQQFMLDADTIFKRGIAECFSNLDRRFRSHDGWKIGSRVILTRVFDENGYWGYSRNHRDTLIDIERTFAVLDGERPPESYGGIVSAIEQARGRVWGARQTEVDSEYFKIRAFMNGNVHLWMKRDDLVERVNQLLGEYYGAPLTDHTPEEDDGGLNDPKTTMAKNYGFFPTPERAAAIAIDGAALYRREGEPRLTVLEPSAGTGNLASLAAEAGAIVDCVEFQPQLADQLRASRRYRSVTQADFLMLQPDPARLYDRIVMNPPFNRERDVDHVMHALKFLAPGGLLVSIMSAGTEFRETRKSTAFRALMAKMNARWGDLPAGSFSSVGTNVNTILLRVWNDARHNH